jgi:hypothetical protein
MFLFCHPYKTLKIPYTPMDGADHHFIIQKYSVNLET